MTLPMPDLPSTITARAIAFHEFIQRRSSTAVIAALMGLSLIKSGIVIWNWFYLSPRLLDTWSNPGNPFQSNVIFNAFGTLWQEIIGPPTGPAWLITQFAVAVVGLGLISSLIYRRTKINTGYFTVAALLTTGIAAVLWREVGRYDVIFLVAVTVAVLARRPWVCWLALGFAALSAPEQALLACVAFALMTLLPRYRSWRRVALRFVVMSVTAVVAVQIWFTLAGNPYSTRLGLSLRFLAGNEIFAPSRFDAKQGFARATFEKFYEGLAAGSSLLWSYLGGGLILLLLALILLPSFKQVVWLIVVVVAFPLAATLVFGEDPTRDLVIVGAPMIILIVLDGGAIFAELVQRLPGRSEVWLTWSALLISMLPVLYFFIYAEEAFNFTIHMLISWNNGTPIDWSGNNR